MYATVLEAPGAPLIWREWSAPVPEAGRVRVMIDACGICRTDLLVVDGELPSIRDPVIPDHEVIDRIDRVRAGVETLKLRDRVSVPWLLIGWRALKTEGKPKVPGLYGFGATAHIIAQVAMRQQYRVYAFTQNGDVAAQQLAISLGVPWARAATAAPPEKLEAAIIFARARQLVPRALRAVRKGRSVVCAGIHMSDIPSFLYRDLWEGRQIVSVANLTRAGGDEFLKLLRQTSVATRTTTYPLGEANADLDALRSGILVGAAVFLP